MLMRAMPWALSAFISCTSTDSDDMALTTTRSTDSSVSAFQRMVVQPRRRKIKVAFDGEIARMRTPIEFRVAAQPLFLLKPSLPSLPT